MKRPLGKVEKVKVTEAWPREDGDFTPWLATEQGMELLQDALGIQLELEETEKAVGTFRADILAKWAETQEDHWVIIENQFNKTDHKHLGQLLTYASGLEAATIVWVAETFDPQHQKALDWLNEMTAEDISFFGLELQLWRIGASEPAPRFNVVVQPNEWARQVKKAAGKGLTKTELQQQRYWAALHDVLEHRDSDVGRPRPSAKYWSTFGIGKPGTWLAACVSRRNGRIWVEFCCHGPPDKVWFDQLHRQKAAIERDIGHPLEWERTEGKKISKVLLPLDPADPSDEADWERQHEWIANRLADFRRVFQPLAAHLTNEPVES